MIKSHLLCQLSYRGETGEILVSWNSVSTVSPKIFGWGRMEILEWEM